RIGVRDVNNGIPTQIDVIYRLPSANMNKLASKRVDWHTGTPTHWTMGQSLGEGDSVISSKLLVVSKPLQNAQLKTYNLQLKTVLANIRSAKTEIVEIVTSDSLANISPAELDLILSNEHNKVEVVWTPHHKGAGRATNDSSAREAYLKELGLYDIFVKHGRIPSMGLGRNANRFGAGEDGPISQAISYYAKRVEDPRNITVITKADFLPFDYLYTAKPSANVMRGDVKHALILGHYLAQLAGRLEYDIFNVFHLEGGRFVASPIAEFVEFIVGRTREFERMNVAA
ncbi:MAG: hypothetical protein PHE61_00970, partial [Candidatus Omnitrophica bacterium]|nr:hypothetical protein [Candidatus Omnitrophota bacterium]